MNNFTHDEELCYVRDCEPCKEYYSAVFLESLWKDIEAALGGDWQALFHSRLASERLFWRKLPGNEENLWININNGMVECLRRGEKKEFSLEYEKTELKKYLENL